MSNWFAMGVHYASKFRADDSFPVWPIFRDNQIACNGYSRGERPDIDAILDEIRYGDYIVLKSFAPSMGMCVYGIGEVIEMNTYPYPIPDGYDNQCVKLKWIVKSENDRYLQNFPGLVGAPYSTQLFKLNGSAIADIFAWLNSIGVRV